MIAETDSKEEDKLTFKLCLTPYMMKRWKKSNEEVGNILEKYHVLEYIDASYEVYNSMGTTGVLEDIEEFIAEQGGSIR
ncbi:MAG: DUF3791 domain-containing protein [Lachnospiraceae bacterium]|nr:DUF3791 domain-containing protein [Lachnospiraceae bacterium]